MPQASSAKVHVRTVRIATVPEPCVPRLLSARNEAAATAAGAYCSARGATVPLRPRLRLRVYEFRPYPRGFWVCDTALTPARKGVGCNRLRLVPPEAVAQGVSRFESVCPELW